LGTGPAIVDVFAARCSVLEGAFAHRHRSTNWVVENGAVVGVRGSVLERQARRAVCRRHETP